MNGRLKAAIALFFALVVAAAVPGTVVAAGPPLEFSDDRTPNPYVHESKLTIAEWDNGQFDSLVEYYNDDGDADVLPATVNSSQDEQLGFRADKIEESSWQQFPRVDGESENDYTWLNASNWTTAGVNSTEMTVSDDDDTTASGVPAVECSSSGIGSGDAGGHCEYETEVNITSDVSKRTLMFVGNFPTMGGDVEIRLVDADGDYYYVTANTSANASKDYVVANSTGNGYVFQEKTNNLLSSGTVDEIQKVRVNVSGGDADVTLVGLDVEQKGTFDLGETRYDFNGDGDDDDSGDVKVISEVYNDPDRPGPGRINYTEASTLGSELSDATIHDLEVWNVRYEMADLTDSADWDVDFENASDYGSYPKKLNFSTRLRVPSAIDLSHGTLDLYDDQGLVDERYAVVEVAEDTGNTDLGNVSDSSFDSKSGSYTNKGGTITLDDTVSAGQNYIIHGVILLQDDEVDALQPSDSEPAGAPPGESGGGLIGGAIDFVMTPFGAIATLIGSLLAGPRILERIGIMG